MAKCKNCGKEIESSCNVCPTCGQINPVKTKKVKTNDITTQIDDELSAFGSYKPKRRIVAAMLFFFVGFTGAPYFYLKNQTKALLSIVSTILILAASLLLGFLVFEQILTPLLVAIALIYLVNIAVGVHYLTHYELKDGKGEFLI